MPSTKKSLLSRIGQDPSCLVDTATTGLTKSIEDHIVYEKVSFHTPGHKGYVWQVDGSLAKDRLFINDLTELPGLDELAYPSGVINDLEMQAAEIWGAHSTLISVNGATAGILATILMLAKNGTHILVPRNCHRSVIHALVLSGLKPIWFEPIWQSEWGLWGSPDIEEISAILEKIDVSAAHNICGLLITSPTYAGALADIKALSELLNKYQIPLVVDEAHGAHLQWTDNKEKAALVTGADIVIHSLHKTLSCLTQTGLVHISEKGASKYKFTAEELRAFLNLVQSSSPSYIFLASIDELVNAFIYGHAQDKIQKMDELAQTLQNSFKEKYKTHDYQLYESPFGTSSTSVLIRHKNYSAQFLQNHLMDFGIFPETSIGSGLLLLVGIGSKENDINSLFNSLDKLDRIDSLNEVKTSIVKPCAIEQIYSPREAFYMPSQVVPVQEAIGQISAECLAPCPPGWPVLIPGQLIGEEILEVTSLNSIRVIKPNSSPLR